MESSTLLPWAPTSWAYRRNVAARVKKVTETQALPTLRKAGIRVLVHGWRKVRGRWQLREVDLSTANGIGRATLERIAAQAAANRASGERLLAEGRPIWEQFPRYTAKGILREMMKRNLPTGRPAPSIRRMHELLKRLRAE